MKKKISYIFGTRPEAIKLSPLILALKNHPDIAPHVCVTGQHREMLDQVLEVFSIRPDVDLHLMQPDQTLGGLTARAIAAIDSYLANYKPDMV
jgi:UDP-N-acetylglucosamine 2-epimerase (non-hydrolysing)